MYFCRVRQASLSRRFQNWIPLEREEYVLVYGCPNPEVLYGIFLKRTKSLQIDRNVK